MAPPGKNGVSLSAKASSKRKRIQPVLPVLPFNFKAKNPVSAERRRTPSNTAISDMSRPEIQVSAYGMEDVVYTENEHAGEEAEVTEPSTDGTHNGVETSEEPDLPTHPDLLNPNSRKPTPQSTAQPADGIPKNPAFPSSQSLPHAELSSISFKALDATRPGLISKQQITVDENFKSSEARVHMPAVTLSEATKWADDVYGEDKTLDWAEESAKEVPASNKPTISTYDTTNEASDSFKQHLSTPSNDLSDSDCFTNVRASDQATFGSPKERNPSPNDIHGNRYGTSQTSTESLTPSLASPSSFPNGGSAHSIPTLSDHTFRHQLTLLAPILQPVPIAGLSEHLLRLFSERIWADWVLQLHSPTVQFGPATFHAHGLIMSRSLVLFSHMSQRLSLGERVVSLLPPTHVQPAAFQAALDYLYTDKLMSKKDVIHRFSLGPNYEQKDARQYQLDCVLSLWMSGVMLGVSQIEMNALEMLRETIDWDILQAAVERILDLQEKLDLDRARAQAASSISLPIPHLNGHSSPPSTTEKSESEKSQYALHPQPPGWTRALFGRVVAFIASNFNFALFQLDASPFNSMQSYLPKTREYSKTFRHKLNPALASITFGSMYVEPEEPRSLEGEADRAVSAILLNAPFDSLCEIHSALCRRSEEEAGDSGMVTELFEKVIRERETRRKKVLTSPTVPNEERQAKKELWSVVGWKESQDEDGDKPTLRRQWVGFLYPEKG